MASEPPTLLVDCDTGIDDAVALCYLAGRHVAGEIRLIGATTTAGNTTAAQAAANTAHVLRACGLGGVPVAAGLPAPRRVALTTTPETHGPGGLGYLDAPGAPPEPAGGWRALWRGAAAEGAALLVTGPATNLAEIGPYPGEVTVMGGAIDHPGNTTETAEWNAWVDPHAAKEAYAFQAEPPATCCPLGATERLTVDPPFLEELVAALGKAPVAGLLPEALRFYFEFHESQGEGYLAKVHDALAAMVALDAIPHRAREAAIDVDVDGERRGTTTARAPAEGSPAARVVTWADGEAARAELLRGARLLAEAWR